MHYTVGMAALNIKISQIYLLPNQLCKFLRLLDPRIVRIRDYRQNFRRTFIVIFVFISLAIGAVALAATGGTEKIKSIDPAPSKIQPNYLNLLPNITKKISLTKADPITNNRPKNFHDPLYVFTDSLATKVTAYPMIDPPGIVVNLTGVLEPEESPYEMVGNDPRIKAVRRRVTDTGIRYIINLTSPIKRINLEHEGNVVIVAPVL